MALNWPRGFSAAGVAAGIKPDGEPDLGLLAGRDSTAWAGTFTQNAAAASCVDWCRATRGRSVRGIIVNSGNANACTGRSGAEAVVAEAKAAAGGLGCSPDEVLVASTGPIGIALPVDNIVSSVPRLVSQLAPPIEPFARAILTTDTAMKTSTAAAGAASITGVAKGAAMLAPNMATMLAFIATDAAFDSGQLEPLLREAVDRSFNRISVDACESTNDSVFLLASGAAGPVATDDFERGLRDVCCDLAEQMVRDGEGCTRTVRIEIEGARDDVTGLELGRAVAASALWRAAVHGADPNWGRVLSALGAVDRDLDLAAVDLSIGPELVFSRGEVTGSRSAAGKAMDSDHFTLRCVVGRGPGSAEVLCSDLSPEYVNLNSTGTL